MPNIEPYPRTCLTLDRYARIMGINPVHFQMSYTNTVFPIQGQCDEVWYRYAWQFADIVSLDEIALEIAIAERDIQNFVNYPLCPTWICDESAKYPAYHRPEVVSSSGVGVGGRSKGVNARWFKIRDVGHRGTEALALDVAVTYEDRNADGFGETAVVQIPYDPETFTHPNCEIKVFVAGTNADPRWEIRYAKHITRDAGAGTITLEFDTWLFVDPDKQATPPMILLTNVKALDLDDPTNLLSTVDVYAEYVDTTTPPVAFFWEQLPYSSYSGSTFLYPACTTCGQECGGTCGCGCCNPCNLNYQAGCMVVRDRDAGIVAPSPATYDDVNARWVAQQYLNCREPNQLRMWYRAGAVSDEYSCGGNCDPLSDYFAQTIAMLATSRLKRTFCGCCGASAKAQYWQTDMARQGEDASFLFEFSLTANPFGTKIGEVATFRRLSSFNVRKLDAALV